MVEAACGSMPGLLGPGGNRNLLSENSLNYLRNTGQPLQIQNNHGTKRSIDTDDDDSIPDQASQQDEHCSDLIGASPKHRRSPLLHLLQGAGPINQYLEICGPLYYAAQKGDWETAKRILHLNPEALCSAISCGQETILHIAAGANQVYFVKMLVEMMHAHDLTLQDKNGNTAFCLAVVAGALEIIEILMQRDRNIATIRGGQGATPLYMAALFGHGAIASRLYPITKDILPEGELHGLFFTCIHFGLFGLALKMLNDYPCLAVARDSSNKTALHLLAQNPSMFSTEQKGRWKQVFNWSNKCKQQSQALKLVKELWKHVLNECSTLEVKNLINRPSSLLFDSAEVGNYEFLVTLICSYHDLVWDTDGEGRTIFHIAVLNRHANVFKLIYELGSIKDIITTNEDSDENNILNLVAKLPSPEKLNVVSGAALQMQQELLWFKEVEKIVQPSLREKKNLNNETPYDIFTRTHISLAERGELWMKQTAKSCTIVATLIATVVFAAAFSVPGGNNEKTGIPIHLREKIYKTFSISSAIAMSASSTSILMFLSILTSCYAEYDFLISLPFKLIFGLATLFISVATMVVSFCMTSFIAYDRRSKLIPILISTLQLLPVILFVYLQYPLLRDIFTSTFYCLFFFHPSKRILHWEGLK